MSNATLIAPKGVDSVTGADGVRYPVIDGCVTLPVAAITSTMWSAGFHYDGGDEVTRQKSAAHAAPKVAPKDEGEA